MPLNFDISKERFYFMWEISYMLLTDYNLTLRVLIGCKIILLKNSIIEKDIISGFL